MTLLSSRSRKRQPRGFTLIEVMIVVAIIGIPAAIAYPSYRDYVIRGALVDATNGLSTARADMERHFQDNRTYASVGGFIRRACAPVASPSATSRSPAASPPPPPGYTLSAGNPGTNVAGFTFTVDQIDQRTTVAPTGWPSLQPALAHEEGRAMLRRRQCRQRGMTIVELMVTISILALLLFLPRPTSARGS